MVKRPRCGAWLIALSALPPWVHNSCPISFSRIIPGGIVQSEAVCCMLLAVTGCCARLDINCFNVARSMAVPQLSCPNSGPGLVGPAQGYPAALQAAHHTYVVRVRLVGGCAAMLTTKSATSEGATAASSWMLRSDFFRTSAQVTGAQRNTRHGVIGKLG